MAVYSQVRGRDCLLCIAASPLPYFQTLLATLSHCGSSFPSPLPTLMHSLPYRPCSGGVCVGLDSP